MSRQQGHLMNEADIGSGQKGAGEHDTEQEVRKVGNPQMKDKADKTPVDPELEDDPNVQARSKPGKERP
jgi:hypothetical protein